MIKKKNLKYQGSRCIHVLGSLSPAAPKTLLAAAVTTGIVLVVMVLP